MKKVISSENEKKVVRQPISKKIRFETFKRDSFTCQYCGKKAPDVVLEIDHIVPVSKGGKNNITNLITSCFECNRGKGKRRLNENDEIKKQQKQLELLNEKHQQLKMIAEWQKELGNIEYEQIRLVEEIICKNDEIFPSYRKQDLLKLIKKCGFDEVCESARISYLQYFQPNSYEAFIKTVDYLFKICEVRYAQKSKPYLKEVNTFLKIIRSQYNFEYSIDYNTTKNIMEKIFKTVYNNIGYDHIGKQVSRTITKSQNIKELLANLTDIYNSMEADNE